MKKTFKIIISLFFVSFLFPNISLAISGACSSHAGVNCSAGFDSDGSVICNDGWIDSSVGYYSVQECNICSSYLYHTGCKNKSDFNLIRDKYGSVFSGMRIEAENKCLAEIQNYETKQVKYEQCMDLREEAVRVRSNYMDTKLKQILEQFSTNNTIPKCPSNSSYNNTTNNCPCDTGYIISGNSCVSADNLCKSSIKDSKYNVTTRKCECGNGFVLKNNQCISYTNTSPQTPSCPTNSSYTNGQCTCNEGYNYFNGVCMTYGIQCKLTNGGEENMIGSKSSDGKTINCNCVSGYVWDGKKCSVYVNPTETQKSEPEIQKTVSSKKPLDKRVNPSITASSTLEFSSPSITKISTTTEKIIRKSSLFKKVWKFIWGF